MLAGRQEAIMSLQGLKSVTRPTQEFLRKSAQIGARFVSAELTVGRRRKRVPRCRRHPHIRPTAGPSARTEVLGRDDTSITVPHVPPGTGGVNAGVPRTASWAELSRPAVPDGSVASICHIASPQSGGSLLPSRRALGRGSRTCLRIGGSCLCLVFYRNQAQRLSYIRLDSGGNVFIVLQELSWRFRGPARCARPCS